MTIGVLALQGGYAAHIKVLKSLNLSTREIRSASDFCELDGLVLPGGESTTQLKLINRLNLTVPLNTFAASGKPILATCAGLILAAKQVQSPNQQSFGWLDITVTRNGWGRQLDSFEGVADDHTTPLCFIRAPRITSVGQDVKVLATLNKEPVMVRQQNIVGAAFHPELTESTKLFKQLFFS